MCARGRHSTPAAYLHVIMKLAHRQQPAPAPTATHDLSTTPAAAAAAGSIDEPATGLSRLTLLLRPFQNEPASSSSARISIFLNDFWATVERASLLILSIEIITSAGISPYLFSEDQNCANDFVAVFFKPTLCCRK